MFLQFIIINLTFIYEFSILVVEFGVPDSENSWIGVSPVGTQARFGGLVAFMEIPLTRTVVLS